MNFIEQRILDLRTMAQTFFSANKNEVETSLKFKSITYANKLPIQEITNRFLPYSDFNFTSAYSWNVENSHAYSLDGDNLILKLADYVTGNPVYTVLGTNHVDKTLIKLIALCKSDPTSSIKLIPEISVTSITHAFPCKIVEDIDNHDYIFSLSELSKLEGRRFKNKRHAANKCEKQTRLHFKSIQLVTKNEIEIINNLINKWEIQKIQHGKVGNESETELLALQRVFTHFNDQNELLLSLAYSDQELVGFSVDEYLNKKYVISHYFKTLPSITGLSEHFNRHVANELLSSGYEYWNWEQDLGIPELRQMKRGYRPCATLKKFKIML